MYPQLGVPTYYLPTFYDSFCQFPISVPKIGLRCKTETLPVAVPAGPKRKKRSKKIRKIMSKVRIGLQVFPRTYY